MCLKAWFEVRAMDGQLDLALQSLAMKKSPRRSAATKHKPNAAADQAAVANYYSRLTEPAKSTL
jgi:hypothetical protein